MQRTSHPTTGLTHAGDVEAVGLECTWHGPVGDTYVSWTLANGERQQVRTCPHCGGSVRVIALEAWTNEAQAAERRAPGAAGMLTWSRGRCFPDHDTLENAWRQAMEE